MGTDFWDTPYTSCKKIGKTARGIRGTASSLYTPISTLPVEEEYKERNRSTVARTHNQTQWTLTLTGSPLLHSIPRPRKRESKLQHPLAGNISNEKHESTVGHICAEPEFATPPADKEIVNR